MPPRCDERRRADADAHRLTQLDGERVHPHPGPASSLQHMLQRDGQGRLSNWRVAREHLRKRGATVFLANEDGSLEPRYYRAPSAAGNDADGLRIFGMIAARAFKRKEVIAIYEGEHAPNTCSVCSVSVRWSASRPSHVLADTWSGLRGQSLTEKIRQHSRVGLYGCKGLCTGTLLP